MSDSLKRCFSTTENRDHNCHYRRGSRFSIAVFLLLTGTVFINSCDAPGPVGNGLESGTDKVETQIFDLERFETVQANTYSGRLENTSVGYVEDPLYGTLRSVALLRPSISLSEVDSIGENDTITLKLVFDSEVYGDESSTAQYEIFEPADSWRGKELRYNLDTAINLGSKVGEFTAGDEDSVEVELSVEWVDKFLEIYHASSADRDSLYRADFKGLAIVPSETNRRIHFLEHAPDRDDDDNIIIESATSLLVTSPPSEDEGEEAVVKAFSLQDWGTLFTRNNEPDNSGKLLLYNTERVIKFDIDLVAEQLESGNIVSAQLLFSADSTAAQDDPAFQRPRAEVIRIHQFTNEPSDLGAELFDRGASYGASRDEDDEALFRIDFTDYVLNQIFGEGDNPLLYLSIQGNNGILYNLELFNENGPENRRPRLLITFVKSDS